MENKTCKDCRLDKPVSEYYLNKQNGCLHARCKACHSLKGQAYYKQNAEKIKANTRLWNEENPEKRREYLEKNAERVRKVRREYNQKNREQRAQYKKDWHEKNKERAHQYRRDRKAKYAALASKRRSAQLQQTPSWLSEDDLQHIECIYQVCAMRTRESGLEWNVDHIVPLQGEKVRGLHVPWNLRVIPAKENQSKGNRFE